MILLVLGLLIFVAIHLFTAVPEWRALAVTRLGEWPYKGVFTVLSLFGLVLAGFGYSRSFHDLIWEGLRFGPELSAALMPMATVLLVAAYLPGNIKRYTAHPMLWGVVLWSIAHLMVLGHLAALLLFGGLGLYSFVAMGLAHRRGVRPSNTPKPIWQDALVVVAGLVLYALLLILHPLLFGVAIIY